MTEALHQHRQLERDFTFQPDSVHPNEAGHWFIAQQLIQWCGEDEKYDSPVQMLESNGIAAAVLKLIQKRKDVSRNAHVAQAGHKRPGVKAGLPLDQAKQEVERLSQEIRAAVAKRIEQRTRCAWMHVTAVASLRCT